MEKKKSTVENLERLINKNFWKKKKVLITGHTGFKGAWLSLILFHAGVKNLHGISLNKNNNIFLKDQRFNKIIKSFYCDINNYKKLRSIILKIKPDITFHFAAQSLVSEGYKFPLKTYKTNILGSINVLHNVQQISPTSVILMTTTDKVYKIKKKKTFFVETDELGGHDPYSASKASLEILINRYINEENLKNKKLGIASCRAGNVIGGGDFSKNRILPDIYRSLKNKKKLKIRFKKAVRPWQHVFEPLGQYIFLAEQIFKNKKFSGSYNFGPQKENQTTVEKIVELVKKRFKELKISFVNNFIRETKFLMLDTKKITNTLKISNKLSLKSSLKLTLDWYEALLKKEDIFIFSKNQITKYFK